MKSKEILILLGVLWMLVSCSRADEGEEEPQRAPVEELVQSVQSSDRLYTTEYVVNKIVTYEDIVKLKGTVLSKEFEIKLPQGDRKVIIPMEARIKAYIDFSDFSRANVKLKRDSSIVITLPDPAIELTSTKIKNKEVKSYVDFGRKRFTNREVAEFEKQGRAAIVQAIPKMGIVEQARIDAYELLMPMMESMGYDRSQITIQFRKKKYSESDYLKKLIRNPLND